MTRKPRSEPGFQTGDRVKVIAEALGWNAALVLQGQKLAKIEVRDDGRISVRFESGGILMGRRANAFEPVGEIGLKANN